MLPFYVPCDVSTRVHKRLMVQASLTAARVQPTPAEMFCSSPGLVLLVLPELAVLKEAFMCDRETSGADSGSESASLLQISGISAFIWLNITLKPRDGEG